MKIDGRRLADEILNRLFHEVLQLKQKGINPQLAVVLVGDNPNSLAYIRQKRKAADNVGIKFHFEHFVEPPGREEVIRKIKQLAQDPNIHGLIVQRPVPETLNTQELTELVPIKKDVDGFLSRSPFFPPVGMAVIKLLCEAYSSRKEVKAIESRSSSNNNSVLDSSLSRAKSKDSNNKFSQFAPEFISWLNSKNIVILGRGETAGKPIAATFLGCGIMFNVIHSQTADKVILMKHADIIVSCVGKANIVKAGNIKKGAIVIGIGLHFEEGKLKGDFEEAEIENSAAFYSPTPRGSGPVNVASLMENVVAAASQAIKQTNLFRKK